MRGWLQRKAFEKDLKELLAKTGDDKINELQTRKSKVVSTLSEQKSQVKSGLNGLQKDIGALEALMK